MCEEKSGQNLFNLQSESFEEGNLLLLTKGQKTYQSGKKLVSDAIVFAELGILWTLVYLKGFCSKNDHFDPCCPIFVLWCIKENLRISYWNFPSVRSLMQSAWRRFLNRTIRRFWEKNFWMCGTWQCYIWGLNVYLRSPWICTVQ